MNVLTTLDLTDRQFLKVATNGVVIYWRVTEVRPRRRTVTREIRSDLWERLLEDPRWIADVLAARVSNTIADARNKWRDDDAKL